MIGNRARITAAIRKGNSSKLIGKWKALIRSFGKRDIPCDNLFDDFPAFPVPGSFSINNWTLIRDFILLSYELDQRYGVFPPFLDIFPPNRSVLLKFPNIFYESGQLTAPKCHVKHEHPVQDGIGADHPYGGHEACCWAGQRNQGRQHRKDTGQGQQPCMVHGGARSDGGEDLKIHLTNRIIMII